MTTPAPPSDLIAEMFPIETAPKDGTPIRVYYDWDNSTEDGVYFAEERQCMLGARAGECGPGFVSVEAGHLPVEPTHWLPSFDPPSNKGLIHDDD